MTGPVSNVALQREVTRLAAQVGEMNETMKQLVEVDLALRLLIRTIKWCASVAAGAAAVWAAWRGH